MRRLVLVLAALLACTAAVPGPVPPAARLDPVTGFADPAGLGMYVYRPAGLPARAPVVVALHGCGQDAQDYADHAGLTTLADRDRFLLVFAEQSPLNNAARCFNWFLPGDTTRGAGEVASIRNMAGYAVDHLGGDGNRVFVTGLSAGGAMTAALLATYPDVFRAGAVVAGVPFGCAGTAAELACQNPGVDLTPQRWAALARDGDPGYRGPWPRVAVWQGDADLVVAPRNAGELRDQWTALHGLGQTPTRVSTLAPDGTRHEEYGTPAAVEVNLVPGAGHGTPVHPGGGAADCGRAGLFYPDSICSSFYVDRFFGLGA